MSTERCLHLLYCWAPPTNWCSPFYGRFRSPLSTRGPLRSWRPYVPRASIAADDSRRNDDAYRQFADMLGEGSYSDSQIADAKSAAYADFADSLGLDGSDREDRDRTSSVAKLSPKKVEIDPEDYNIFDQMLERTGGRGRKLVKGAKPYSRYITKGSRLGTKERKEKRGAVQVDIDSNKPEEDTDSQTIPGLTEEEKVQAYAVMMEEFGPGSHDGVETWTPDDDVDEPEQEPLQLMAPPERPGVARPVEPATQTINQTDSDVRGQELQLDIEDVTLQPKPSWQSPEGASPPHETAQTTESENEMEATDEAPSEAPVASTSTQLDLETPLHEEHLQDQGDQEAQTFKTRELKARPTRPVPLHFLSERSQVSAEGGTWTSEPITLPTGTQTSEQVTPSVLPKPLRQQESQGEDSANSYPFELNTSSNRPFFRKQRRHDEQPEVLKDPKLVYRSE